MLGITFNPYTWKSDLRDILTLNSSMTETTVCKFLYSKKKEDFLEFFNEMENHQRKIDVQTQSSPQIQQSLGNLEENGETWRKMFINAVVCIFEYSA